MEKDETMVQVTCTLPAWLAEEAEKNNLDLSQILRDELKARLGL